MTTNSIERARSALNTIDPQCSREEWVRIAMAAKSAELSFDDFHEWSAAAANYEDEKSCRAVWKSIDDSGSITAGTLFFMACDQGWRDQERSQVWTNARNSGGGLKKSSESETGVTNEKVLEVWERCELATINEPYISRKDGVPDGLRVYPASASPLIIQRQNVAGYLAVPCWFDDQLKTIQFIPPGNGKKLNLRGTSFGDGYFTVGTIAGLIYLVEGIGQAWAVYKATGMAAVVCFGAHRMPTVAKVLRAQYPSDRLVIVPDRGKEKEATQIAATVNGQWVELPSGMPKNDDVNDYALESGHDELEMLLSHAKAPALPLSVVFADELPHDFTPPDELVEGVITAGDGSILYGDSNSAKTFFVIDMTCAVARGVEWLGRKTEAGLVIYLAAESPASVMRRLQAYQKHHNVRVMNFAIVQSPIDLFDGEADTDAVIKTVRVLEEKCGQKARLIIGDTLARLSAGANESAGQDMSLVVRHFDRIRSECNAHFMLIHHSGKNAAAGARGWSGVRAAVDTEIEVTDSPGGRCAEITKQRDLSTKGVRIGFRLDPVTLGLTKWKSPATSCVVVSADAPPKNTGKRLSEVGGAISEYLCSKSNPVKKRDLVNHFAGRYGSTSIYRQLKSLVQAGIARESMGLVSAVNQGGIPSEISAD